MNSPTASPAPGPSEGNPFRISPKRIDVAFLPSLVPIGGLTDRTVIVTDVLRATTTIIHALFNGCQQVLPQPSIESARTRHAETENSVMGGERGGKIIEGFHQGNSPIEYTPDVIGGKSLVLATTNGTVAMEHCRPARRVLIGAMINIGAVANMISVDEAVTVMCSGTDGYITSEDVLFAGAMVERILATSSPASDQAIGTATAHQAQHHQLTDHAAIALNHWQTTRRAVESGTELADFFRTARGGINLVKIGLDADIVFASQIDTVPVVPQLDVGSWSIRLPAAV